MGFIGEGFLFSFSGWFRHGDMVYLNRFFALRVAKVYENKPSCRN